jgi:ribokinase
VVVTRGADGCLVAGPDGVATVAARDVPVIDTTGAGDCFAAALGLGLAEERPPVAAAALASAAAALAVTRPGAQALPSRAEVEALLGG